MTGEPDAIDQLILTDDKRGIAALAPFVPAQACRSGAQRLLDREKGRVLIVTGFYEIKPGVIETDGPPGALAIGRALAALGYEPHYVTDKFAAPFLEPELTDGEALLDFPIAPPEESKEFAAAALARYEPVAVIAVERCGVTADGRYLNMSAQDLTPYTARTDYLIADGIPSIGIGDGGNEIGMGAFADVICDIPELPDHPAVTATDHLIIASVSNWGAYGLVAALSRASRRDLLPEGDAEAELISRLADKGAVDGEFLTPMPAVDGFSVDENERVLESLRGASAAV